MSLILEALRKSEAQRRLGQAPDLHAPVATTAPRGRLPRWLVPALALMLVGAVAWWLGRMAVPDPSNGTATEAVVEPGPLPLPAATTDPGPPATRAELPAELPPPAPEPGPAPEPARAVETAPAPSRPEVASGPASGPRPAPTPQAAPPAPPAAPAAPAQRTDAVASEAVAPAAQATPSGTAEPSPPPVEETDAGLMRLADLPAATRASLPPLRISMHVYSDEPARRFAIIDGRRVGEGGLLEGQGVVESVRRDGIVVDFDGRRVLLPRP